MSWLINQAGKLEPIMSKGLEFRRYDEKSIDMVFRTLPKCQVLIDKVLECTPSPDILYSDHNLAQAAMSNTLRESFQVYMTFYEGIAALVNMIFDLTASARGLACEILKKASPQSQKLHDLPQNQLAASHVSLSSRKSISEVELAVAAKEGKRNEDKIDINLSPSLFSQTLETKRSNVWVVFEDEAPNESLVLPAQQKLGDADE
ncbi:hypothetical protein TanjilG_07390 [Lupinus angustifolius]|uniref:AP180 N-terminal homology (ANTH) domain-containing protein n=1 Tax=Lupinus angustifolius TaxID=3871 RepID=A0A4P1R076_LUPAN|nr:hypothetical protein TanjilG_07390 [Lupinus angustifolius]